MSRTFMSAAAILVAAWPAIAAADEKSDCAGNTNLDVRIQACSALVGRDPKDATSFYHRGTAYQSKGDLDKAIADLGKTIELKPGYAAAYEKRALIYVSKGDYVSAIADANKASELKAKPVVPAKTATPAPKQKVEPPKAKAAAAPKQPPPASTTTGSTTSGDSSTNSGGLPAWAQKVMR